MKELEKKGVCVQIPCQIAQSVYREFQHEAYVRNICIEQNFTRDSHIKMSQTSSKYIKKSARSSTSSNIDHVESVWEVIRNKCRLTIREFAAEFEHRYKLMTHEFDGKPSVLSLSLSLIC